jgi:hypothetical protein
MKKTKRQGNWHQARIQTASIDRGKQKKKQTEQLKSKRRERDNRISTEQASKQLPWTKRKQKKEKETKQRKRKRREDDDDCMNPK